MTTPLPIDRERDTIIDARPLSPRLAEAIRGVPAGRIAVVVFHPGLRAVLKGDHPDFDAAEQQAAEARATGRFQARNTFLLRHNDDATVTVYHDRNRRIGKPRPLPRLPLPPVDEDADSYLDALRREADELGRKLAHAELGAAARIIVSLFGAHAARLLVAEDETDSGDTTIVPLVLFDADDRLLWFNPDDYRYDSCNYPGTEHIQTTHGRPVYDVTSEVVDALTTHLEAGYDAVGGCGHALHAGGGERGDYFGSDVNVLDLDIPAALEPWYMIPPPSTGPKG